MTEIHVVIESQYDKSVRTPFKEVIGVFSSAVRAKDAVQRLEENNYRAWGLPSGVWKITYDIEQYRPDDF